MLVMAIMMLIGGCTIADRIRSANVQETRAGLDQPPPDIARHIEIELDDPANGLPCNVVDWPDDNTRTLLWRAEYDAGFCQRKAKETLSILRSQGWACRLESAEEREQRSRRLGEADPSRSHYVHAAWSCLEGLEAEIDLDPQIEQAVSHKPNIPAPRPSRPTSSISSAATLSKQELVTAVKKDLAVIGQDVVDHETEMDIAEGDLNGDGRRDAAVMVTRERKRAKPHQLLMAYLGGGDAYKLVDVWVVRAPSGGTAVDGPLAPAIEGGKIRLSSCCGERADPIVLVLAERRLTYVDGG